MLLLSACSRNQKILWVNSYLVDCGTSEAKQCFQVYEGEILDRSAWVNYEGALDGFQFEPGYIYQLTVRPEQIQEQGKEMVKYHFRDLVEKVQDPLLRLSDLWLATSIDGEKLEQSELQNFPTLEIHLPTQRVYGTDGCNNYHGALVSLDETNIEFSHLATTRKMCIEMNVPDRYSASLMSVTSYRVEDGKLYLFDSDDHIRIEFRHID